MAKRSADGEVKNVANTGQETYNEEYTLFAANRDSTFDADRLIIMKDLGYTDEMMKGLPKDVLTGLGCGAPPAHLSLKPGMRTLDLGSGVGTDVIICGKQVQPGGLAIGMDILDVMNKRAEGHCTETVGLNADATMFIVGNLNEGCLKTWSKSSYDAVTANCCVCFLHLDSGIPQILDLLKPGGKICFSESTLEAPLPPAVKEVTQYAFKHGIAPVGHSLACKVWRSWMAIGGDDPLIAKDLMAKLTKLGCSDCKVEIKRNVPGTRDWKKDAPEFSCKSLSEAELKEFRAKAQAAISAVDINQHVQFTTISCSKPK